MILEYDNPLSLSRAIRALTDNDVFVYPTDTLYGFGGNACSDSVLDRIYNLKERPGHMPVSMLVADMDMLLDYAILSPKARMIADAFYPGAITLVLPAKRQDLPEKLFSMEGYLGFRIPDHEFCKNMSEHFDNPIITTSVNRSGNPTLNDIHSIHAQFGDKVDLMISDARLDAINASPGSTVIMISRDDTVKVLREGAIKTGDILRIIR